MAATCTMAIEEMVRRYTTGETVSAIAQVAGLTFEPVRRKLKAAGVTLRARGRQNVYELNEDYFAEIDTEEKAYWLGFSLADGCVDRNDGRLRYSLGLAPSEFDHVVKFRNAVGSNAPVSLTNKTARLQLTRPRFCEHLIRHGCEPGKTATHGLPVIPQHLYKHLFRGAFDGDGSIFEQGLTCKLADGSDCRYKQWRASFVGSQLFVTEFQNWVQRETGVAPKTLEHCGRVVEFRYGSTRQTAVFLSTIYADATVYLQRKFDLYQQVIAWVDENVLEPVADAVLVAAYENGATIKQLADAYQRSGGAIRKQLYRGGATMRPRGWNRKRP